MSADPLLCARPGCGKSRDYPSHDSNGNRWNGMRHAFVEPPISQADISTGARHTPSGAPPVEGTGVVADEWIVTRRVLRDTDDARQLVAQILSNFPLATTDESDAPSVIREFKLNLAPNGRRVR